MLNAIKIFAAPRAAKSNRMINHMINRRYNTPEKSTIIKRDELEELRKELLLTQGISAMTLSFLTAHHCISMQYSAFESITTVLLIMGATIIWAWK